MRIRLTAAFGIAAAVLCLTACRSSPGVAAYVGDTQITEARVTTLLDGYNQKAPADQQIGRAVVVQYLVHDELCKRLKEEKGFSFEQQSLPAEAPEFAVVATRAETCMRAIPAPDQKPSDDDYKALYDRAIEAQLLPAGTPFDRVVQQWQTDEELNSLLGREKSLSDAAEVTVNPRYGQMTIVGFNPLVAGRLGGGRTVSDVVVDRPVPVPSAQAQQ